MSKKRNRAEIPILLLLAIIVSIFFMSCETTKTKIEYVLIDPPEVPIDSVFNVSTTEEWDYAIEKIRAQGDGHSYLINILDDFGIVGSMNYGEMTFGTAKNISVVIDGEYLAILGFHYMLGIGQFQNVTINNLRMGGTGVGNVPGLTPRILVIGTDAVLTFQGDATIDLLNVGIEIHHGGTFNLLDNACLWGFSLAVIVNEYGVFNMRDNASIKNGGQAVVIDHGGKFNMYGGTIINNYLRY